MPCKLDKHQRKIISYYMLGHSNMWIANKFNVGERTVTRFLQRLRMQKLIPPRINLETTKQLATLDDTEFNEAKKKARLEWKTAQSSISRTKNKPFKTYLVTYDHHVPDHDIPANRAVHRLMEDVIFDGFIIGGDFVSLEPISSWNEKKRKTLETKRLKEDYIAGNALLDEYDKRLPKNCEKYYLWGNHEMRYAWLLEKLPVLEGLFNPTEELLLRERGF